MKKMEELVASSDFAGQIPEKPVKVISLIDDSAVEDLKKEPKRLEEESMLDIDDYCVD